MLDRGQTETLGAILVFALITISIGLVYTAGFSGLLEARQFEQTNNAQRALHVFADNIEDMTQRNAPSRATEVKLSGSTLSLADPITIRVNVTGTTIDETYSIRPLIYDAETGERIIYVQGAVLREREDDAVISRESTMIFQDNRTLIPIVQTRLIGSPSVGGSTTVLVRAIHADTDIVYLERDNPPTVWLNITSPRADAWAAHLEPRSAVTNCAVSDGTASCQVDSERITVTLIQIDIALE